MLRRRRFGRKNSVTMNDMSLKECETVAYYLYAISEIIYNEDDSFYSQQIKLFFKLADRLKKRETISTFLSDTVKKYEKAGRLTPLPHPADGESPHTHITFDYSDVRYLYEEDKEIERGMPSTDFKIDLDFVNLYRCRFSAEDNFFCRLTANFLLRKNPTEDFSLLEKIPAHIEKAVKDKSLIKFITDSVNLKDSEADYLMFSYRCSRIGALSQLINELGEEARDRFRTKMLGITEREYNNMLKKTASLRSYAFIDDDGALEDDLIECITNQSLDSMFADLIKEEDCTDAYELESFTVNKNAGTIMQKMLAGKESISLLLYGKPGSGKTQYAKSLAKATGLKPLIFKNEAELEKGSKGSNSVLCRLNLLLSIARTDTLLIVDEADTLLKTRAESFFGLAMPSPNKGTVNKMLENSKNKIIWIVNFTGQIDESTLRRFNFSYKFESMTKEQIRSITNTKLTPLHLTESLNGEILGLMEKYSITGASVDNVVKTIKSLDGSENEELLDCIQTILKENSTLINGKSKMRETVSESYDSLALNATMNPDQIVTMIENARAFAEKNRTEQNGIRMLFYGLSGTGKTEFARYIAEKLGKKLLLKRASDILDKYVGGSEKNIRDAFEEASRTDSILLFDEADSFFADRNSAEHSWERTQVNEFLTQMEEFPGILICTTNLKKIMDPALNRRFHMIVEFKPLEKNGIKRMIERYFSGYEFTDGQIERLERRSTVTPGDFGTLSNKMRFMNPDDLTAEYITCELCKMQEEKDGGSGNKIGFCA